MGRSAFDPKNLTILDDAVVGHLLTTAPYTPGQYIDIHTPFSFREKFKTASFEYIKTLPRLRLSIFKTRDIGIGVNGYLSRRDLQMLISLGKLDPETPVELAYRNGNVVATIDLSRTDVFSFLTDDSYVIYSEEENKVWWMKIGTPPNPNRLYSLYTLVKTKVTLRSVLTNETITAFWLENLDEED